MTILILGTSAWLPGRRPQVPDQLRAALYPEPKLTATAGMSRFEVRVALANLLTRNGAPAIVMESEEPRVPRNLTRKFHELMEKHWVDEYYIYWPFGAARQERISKLGSFWTEWAGPTPTSLRTT
jgi:hypothetical protein